MWHSSVTATCRPPIPRPERFTHRRHRLHVTTSKQICRGPYCVRCCLLLSYPSPPPPHAGSQIHAAYNALPPSTLLTKIKQKKVQRKGEKEGENNNEVSRIDDFKPRIKKPTLGQKPLRLKDINQIGEEGGFVRVHVNPKRFSRCYEIDWASTILLDTPDYVVINKPTGVPVGGTVDNQVESCVSFVARALGLPEKLFPTHQLDTCTQGCVVLAKTKAFASHFNLLLRERKVRKIYRALTTTSTLKTGSLIHFMRPGKYAPRIVKKEMQEGWSQCELEVLECRQLSLPSLDVFQREGVSRMTFPSNPKNVSFEYTIRLVTGRTHQLRAQFAECGAPLVGDSMYIPLTRRQGSSEKDNVSESLGQDSSKKDSLSESFGRDSTKKVNVSDILSPSQPSSPKTEATLALKTAQSQLSDVRSEDLVEDLTKNGEREDEMFGIETESGTKGGEREAMGVGETALSDIFVEALALQAWKISWEGGPLEIEAPDPWWVT